jgi:TM2 domain-containing membrane protein YozV
VSTACPYCRAGFEAEDEITICPTCATPHHGDCFAENKGCTIFGCAAAPRDEPKISVLDQDLAEQSQSQTSSPPSFLNLQSPGPQPEANSRSAPPPPPPPPPPPEGPVPPPPMPESSSLAAPGSQPLQTTTRFAMPTSDPWYDYAPRKSRVVFVFLAVFLGAFGGHNFYAGYAKKGTIQICITLFTCFYGSFISWIWALVEACTVKHDDDGVVFN